MFDLPRNSVTALFMAIPRKLHSILEGELKKLDKVSYTATEDPYCCWPHVPYHYGMGRLISYDEWFDSLSEEMQKKEQIQCRIRYEDYYDRVAYHAINRMKEMGHNLMPYLKPEQKKIYYKVDRAVKQRPMGCGKHPEQIQLASDIYHLKQMEEQIREGVEFNPGAYEKEKAAVQKQAALVRQRVRERMSKKNDLTLTV